MYGPDRELDSDGPAADAQIATMRETWAARVIAATTSMVETW